MADARRDAEFREPVSLPTGAHHDIVIRRPRFELQVLDCFGEPAASVFAELALPGGVLGMVTDDDGRAVRRLSTDQAVAAQLAFPDLSAAAATIPEPAPAATAFEGDALDLEANGEHVVQLPPRVVRARLCGLLFDTDKTFLLPESLVGIRQLAAFWEQYPHAHVLVVGHTDTVGQPGHNGPLSEERAESVAAFLVDDVDAWLAAYQPSGHTSATWGVPEDKLMLSHLRDADDVVFYEGPIDPIAFDAATMASVERFQQWSNATQGTALVVDGALGPNTRRALVTAYMAEDGTTLPETVELATHGCGESHPLEPTGDEVDEQDNRRVEVFIFEAGIEPPPSDNATGACEEYPAWVAQVGIDIDLREEPPRLVEARWER